MIKTFIEFCYKSLLVKIFIYAVQYSVKIFLHNN